MSANPRRIRKAAILIASLDREAADIVMNQMTPLEARLVRRAMVELGSPDPIEQNNVIEDFFRTVPRVLRDDLEGMELGDDLLSHVTQPAPQPTRPKKQPQDKSRKRPLHFLKHAAIEPLAPLLERERPQTIAVVLSHLAPESAAELLSRLPAALQVEVTHRMIELDQIDAAALEALEAGVAVWLEQHAEVRDFRGEVPLEGRSAVHQILSMASAATRENMLAALPESLAKPTAVEKQAAPREIAPPAVIPMRTASPAPPVEPRRVSENQPLSFAAFCQLDSHSAAAIVAEAYPEVAALALIGADADFSERVLDQMSTIQASMIRANLRDMGPTSLADVELAQQEIARLATQRNSRQQSSTVANSRLSVVG